MNRKVTIVMYHYVRDLERSRFPAIKGLTIERFIRQLDYIQGNYDLITIEDLFNAISSPHKYLPPNPILLTFDDGYSDHFLNVFPLLGERGIRGCFFPSAQAVLEHRVLDVNKIQFVLASVPNAWQLLDEVFESLDEFREEHSLKSREGYLMAITEKHRYDPREVTILKRLLQRELPEKVRAELVRRLFVEYVTSDEEAFARELYMSVDQIGCMRRQGMHIGSHGFTHAWLDRLQPENQATEIDRSLMFLQELGADMDQWTICYPYGGFNESLLELLQNRRCRLGFTVEARTADLNLDGRLTLPRIDTNDLPS
jgi:peptidoglycan/xylan/chitin deacetylase (PgdA/CDA1 family)